MDGLPQISDDMGALPDLGQMGTTGDMGGFDMPPPVTRMPAKLPKKTKAAIIVKLMAAQDVKLPLATFPEEMQVELAHQLTDLRYIDKDTLTAVVEEFLEELDSIGLSFPGGLEGALSVLEGTISGTTASKLRTNAGFPFWAIRGSGLRRSRFPVSCRFYRKKASKSAPSCSPNFRYPKPHNSCPCCPANAPAA